MLKEQMRKICSTPAVTYYQAAKVVFGTKDNPISVDDTDSPSSEDEPIDAGLASPIPEAKDVVPPETTLVKQVLGDIVQQEGYVIISNVMKAPGDDGWWRDMIEDLNTLQNTNNNVTV